MTLFSSFMRRTGLLKTTLCAAAWLGLTMAAASPPPTPDELKYPNIIKPIAQFGVYGSGIAELNEPSGIDFGLDGSVYIADLNKHRIVQMDLKGNVKRSWGSLGQEPGQFKFPHALGIDPANGDVYVADTGNRRVQVFAADGRHLRTLAPPAQQPFGSITGVAARNGRVVVVDAARDRVYLFEHNKFQGTIGGSGDGAGQFDQPADVTIDDNGYFYVADSYNNRIQKFTPEGRHVLSWGGWGSHSGFLATPSGIRFRAGKLYVADLINHRIQVFGRDGQFLYQWGRHPAVAHEGQGRMHYPHNLAVSHDGARTVICEPFEYRCQVFANDTRQLAANVDDTAWWDKATRFHYGSKVSAGPTIAAIAEPDTHSVLIFDNVGEEPKLLTKLGGQGREPGKFVRPSGMYLDEEKGQVLVSDGGNHRLQLFQLQKSLSGNAYVPNSASLVKSISLLNIVPKTDQDSVLPPAPIEPSAIIRSADGLYFVADPHNARILVLTKDLKYMRAIGKYGTNPGELLVPSNIAFSPDQRILYVVDTYNFRIQAYDRAGKYLFHWGGPGIGSAQFMHAFGIAVDKAGNVFVGDDGANRIQKFDAKGGFIKKWGQWGTEPGQFYKPKGIAIDPRGRLMVMNFGNHRGEVFDTEGNFLFMFGIADGYSIPVANTEREVTDRNSNAGTYVVSYKVSPAQVPLNQLFDIELRVVDSKFRDAPPDDLQVAVDAVMPAHHHGMNVRPTIVKTSKGAWKITGMNFHMPGYWKLSFDLTRGRVTERADFDITVKNN